MLIRQTFINVPTRVSYVDSGHILSTRLNKGQVLRIRTLLERVHFYKLSHHGWEQMICVNPECVTSFWTKEEMTVTIRVGLTQRKRPIVTFTYWDYFKSVNIHQVSSSYWRTVYRKIVKLLANFEPHLR